MQLPSPISKITVEGRVFFVKRDDLIDPYLSGNKFRKLHTLLQTPKEQYSRLISYGGTQSNAMLALAAIAKQKGWQFIYYTKNVNAVVKKQQEGSYFEARSLGMEIRELGDTLYKEFISAVRLNLDKRSILIDQGGAGRDAREGLEVLAAEIREQLKKDKYREIKAIATPSGTGTTALYLALALPEYRIYTTPSVGGVDYLKVQMQALHEIPENLVILEHAKKYHFAKLYDVFFEVYEKLKECGIEFDLLYAPSMWLALLEKTEETILYVHSGGLSGNSSMLARYRQRLANKCNRLI